jgi:hypothetical protein
MNCGKEKSCASCGSVLQTVRPPWASSQFTIIPPPDCLVYTLVMRDATTRTQKRLRNFRHQANRVDRYIHLHRF